MHKLHNVYNFIRVEKWCNSDRRLQGYVGFTSKDIFLTWDVREEGTNDEYPVFSIDCKVGSPFSEEDFYIFRDVFEKNLNKSIKEIEFLFYKVLGLKKMFTFIGQKVAA